MRIVLPKISENQHLLSQVRFAIPESELSAPNDIQAPYLRRAIMQTSLSAPYVRLDPSCMKRIATLSINMKRIATLPINMNEFLHPNKYETKLHIANKYETNSLPINMASATLSRC